MVKVTNQITRLGTPSIDDIFSRRNSCHHEEQDISEQPLRHFIKSDVATEYHTSVDNSQREQMQGQTQKAVEVKYNNDLTKASCLISEEDSLKKSPELKETEDEILKDVKRSPETKSAIENELKSYKTADDAEINRNKKIVSNADQNKLIVGNVSSTTDDEIKGIESKLIRCNQTIKESVFIEEVIDKKKIKRKRSSSTSMSEKEEKKPHQQSLTVTRKPGKDSSTVEMSKLQKKASLFGVSVQDAIADEIGKRPRLNSTDGELNLPRRGLCDESTILACHVWRHKQIHQPRGFVNMGNTCFLNATLQCLAYLPTFSQSVTRISSGLLSSKRNKKINQEDRQKLPDGKRIAIMLSSLFRKLHNRETDENGQYKSSSGPIAPKAIVNALSIIGQGVSRKGLSKFKVGRQEDAHEFLVHLLSILKDGELQHAGINIQKPGWRDKLPISRLDETTLIHRAFGGYYRSQVVCTACKHKSNTYDPFLDLALEVSSQKCNSVQAAIEEFTRKETLDSENRWKCGGCKKRVCATKRLTVFRPPLTLCVQLKRFTFQTVGGYRASMNYNSSNNHIGKQFGGKKAWKHNKKKSKNFHQFGSNGFRGGMGGDNKIRKPIDFPYHLSLPLSDKRKCEYALSGVVIHMGGTSSSGHYTAYVKKPHGNEKSNIEEGGGHRWYYIDDSTVNLVSEKNVLRQGKDCAYVLFYSRTEVKVQFPSPPRKSNMSASEASKYSSAKKMFKTKTDDNTHIPVIDDASSTIVKKKCDLNGNRDNDNALKKVEKVEELNLNLSSNKKELVIRSIEKRVSGTLNPHQNNHSGTNLATPSSICLKSTPQDCNRNKHPQGQPTKNHHLEVKVDPMFNEEIKPKDKTHNSNILKNNIMQDEKEKQSHTTMTSIAYLSSNKISDSKEKLIVTAAKINNADKNPGKIVVDRGSQGGKVEMVAGVRRVPISPNKDLSSSSTTSAAVGGRGSSDLLGNILVGKWDDGENDETVTSGYDESESILQKGRRLAFQEMEANKRKRRRHMHLDRWDAKLDEGKKRKIKLNKNNGMMHASNKGGKNQFHVLQSKKQKLDKGQAKGNVYHKGASGSHKQRR